MPDWLGFKSNGPIQLFDFALYIRRVELFKSFINHAFGHERSDISGIYGSITSGSCRIL